MAKAFLNGLINLFIKLIGLLGSVLIYPLQVVIVNLFPDVHEFNSIVLDFMNLQVFPFVSWLKGLFLNLTGFPAVLMQLLIVEVFGYIAAAVTIRTLLLVYRLYLFIRGHEI